LEGLRPDTRYAVLDLGAPVGPNLDFLTQMSCRVRIADFHRSLHAEPIEGRDVAAFVSALERLLPIAENEHFDIVLSWDVFNYLRPEQISALMAHLAPACLPEALVFALISTRPQIPATPLRYRIVDRESLSYEGTFEPLRPCPRYMQTGFGRMMPGFRIKGSYLLRNGIQEYLFTRRDPARIETDRMPFSTQWPKKTLPSKRIAAR
jgi:hypothetical protein